MHASLSRLIVTGVTIGLTATVGIPAAQASPPPGNISIDALANSRSLDDIERYWTPERMAEAVDLDIETGERPAGGPRRPDGVSGSVEPVAARNGIRSVDQSQAVGKVYMTTPSGPAACSASAVNSPTGRLVITAGHCVHGGAGQDWYTDFIFVPALRQGDEPYGRFVASTLTTRSAWAERSDLDQDIAIAVMSDGASGDTVVDTVGGMGLRWNWGYQVDVTILGYPAADGFPGDVQYYCQSGTWQAEGEQVRAWCDMTGGSSGGPWLQEYDDDSGLGYVNSVVSHGHGHPGQFDGPYFDGDVADLYTYAESLA
ncbi:trypsin-like serine peptidase [Actinoplanes subglobosus]|uniref:Trypsin-like serine peptidase n=1 Tax=Actinoplanes subglobosus TaxID=1547892 RepID=A0ABV8J6Y5_9ACTN